MSEVPMQMRASTAQELRHGQIPPKPCTPEPLNPGPRRRQGYRGTSLIRNSDP